MGLSHWTTGLCHARHYPKSGSAPASLVTQDFCPLFRGYAAVLHVAL